MSNEDFKTKNIELFRQLRKYSPESNEYIRLRNEIFDFNYPLITSFLYKSTGTYPYDYCNYNDYVQELSIRLLRAIEKYDPDNAENASFSTYAYFWLFQGIKFCAYQNRPVYIPKYIYDGKEIDPAIKNIDSLDEIYNNEEILLDKNMEEISVFGEYKDTEDPVKYLFIEEISEIIYKKSKLTDREKELFICRYKDEMTLEQIGKKYCLTKERVRQILIRIGMKVSKALNERLFTEDVKEML